MVAVWGPRWDSPVVRGSRWRDCPEGADETVDEWIGPSGQDDVFSDRGADHGEEAMEG